MILGIIDGPIHCNGAQANMGLSYCKKPFPYWIYSHEPVIHEKEIRLCCHSKAKLIDS